MITRKDKEFIYCVYCARGRCGGPEGSPVLSKGRGLIGGISEQKVHPKTNTDTVSSVTIVRNVR